MKPVLPGRDRPYERLVAIMAALRGEPGCPWDRRQDLPGLLHYMESEFQEVVQAVHAGDPAALREELGDLLFNIVFMARVAEERRAGSPWRRWSARSETS